MEIPSSWTFKTSEVASHFEEHVREQLPWYDELTALVAVIARHYMPEGSTVYDIGASTGNLGRTLASVIEARRIRWIGVENSEAMREIYNAPGELLIQDALTVDYLPCDLAICFLSLMFFPAETRKHWLFQLLTRIKPGGAIVVVDKEQAEGGILSTALHRYVMETTIRNGARAEDVLKKESSLCGIQRPLPRDFFDGIRVREFFRFGDFAGYVIEKAEA